MAGRRDIQAGRATVTINARNERLKRALRGAQRQLRSFASSAQRIGRTIAAAGAAMIVPLTAAAKKFASVGDDLDKLARRTGIAADRLAGIGFAAEQNGSSLDAFGNAILRMNRRLGRITAGQGEASQVNALESLGLSAERLEQLDPESRFLAIADAMNAMEDPAEAAGLAQRAFGTAVDKILPLLQQGSDGINEMASEFDELFGNISDRDVGAAVELTDAFGRLGTSIRGLVFGIGGSLAPVLTGIIDDITRTVVNVREWVGENRELIRTIAAGAAGAVALGVGIIGVGVALGTLAALFGPVITALGAVISASSFLIGVGGLPALAAGFAAAGAATLVFANSFDDLKEIATDTASEIIGASKSMVGGVVAALESGDIEAAAEIVAAGVRVIFEELFDGLLDSLREVLNSLATSGLKETADSVARIAGAEDASISGNPSFLDRAELRVALSARRNRDRLNSFFDSISSSIGPESLVPDRDSNVQDARDALQELTTAAKDAASTTAADRSGGPTPSEAAAGERIAEATAGALPPLINSAFPLGALTGSGRLFSQGERPEPDMPDRESIDRTIGNALVGFNARLLQRQRRDPVEGQILEANRRQVRLLERIEAQGVSATPTFGP